MRTIAETILPTWGIVRRWKQNNSLIGQRMSEIALIQEVFPEDQIRDFLTRGLERAIKTVNAVMARFRGRTYLEWYTYFEERNFQPILREAPIMARVLLVLYEGMVMEAKAAAQNWTTLPPKEREQYRRMALLLSSREPTTYTMLDRIGLTYECLMVGHNFFQDIEQQNRLFDEFIVIITEAVAGETTTAEVFKENLEAWKKEEEFYDMLLDQIDEDLNRDYSQQELETLERVQRRLNNEETNYA